MSNSSKYYETMPNNFPDDLADALMVAFNIESVDSKEEMPHFLDTLYQRGYQVTVRPDLAIDIFYFLKVEPRNITKNLLQASICDKLTQRFDDTTISDLEELTKNVKELNEENNKEYFGYTPETAKAYDVLSGKDKETIRIYIGDICCIKCYKIKA